MGHVSFYSVGHLVAISVAADHHFGRGSLVYTGYNRVTLPGAQERAGCLGNTGERFIVKTNMFLALLPRAKILKGCRVGGERRRCAAQTWAPTSRRESQKLP